MAGNGSGWRNGRTVNKPEKRQSRDKVQYVIDLDPKHFETVEVYHVWGLASPITHYLIKAGPTYFHNDNLNGEIKHMNEAEFQYYSKHRLRKVISKETVKVPDPRAAAFRVKRALEQGFYYNVITCNCYDWPQYVIWGPKGKPKEE
jgi:hypothetical protein